MTPYYDEGGITIYHGDCRDVLPTIAAADLVLTDPPYNLGMAYGAGTDDERSDYAEWCASWFALSRKVGREVALTPGIANIGLWYAIEKPDWVIAWHKPAAMGRCLMGFNNWEPVLYWGGAKQGVDVITAQILPDLSLVGHPCPKPLGWARRLLALLGGTSVIDPFMGTGTTLRAAKDLGRRAIGIEVNEAYCEIAARRLSQEVFDLEVA